ncbi:MAG TPA: transcriptional regulator NrdR [Phycisphaerae bacterium]|nr:transcriptional regulator NrdR [Phycisphaerae bacterium]
MRCPSCKELSTDKVIDSRLTDGGAAVRRRRHCTSCGRRFTTKERIEMEMRLSVVKRDGSREPYRRDKVVRGVQHACYKLDIQDAEIERLVDRVEEDLHRNHEREVSSEQIGQYVAVHLRQLNHIAYVRFMSVFRKFADVAEFVDEINDVTERAATESPDQPTLFEG